MKLRPAHLIFLSVAGFLFALTIVPPYLSSLGYGWSSDLAFAAYKGYCHQLPERSFTVFGSQMPVCARCFGVYFGLFLGTLLYPVASNGKMPPGWVIIAAVLPLSVDGFTQFLGFRQSDSLLRLFTGALFGVVIPYYLLPVLEDILDSAKKQRKHGGEYRKMHKVA